MERVERFSQAYSQAPWRKQLAIIGLFLLVVVFIAIIAGIYLSVTARASTFGREIQSIQATISVLDQNNADLKTRLGQFNSSGEMEARARALGFKPVETDTTLYIVVPGYIDRQPIKLAPSFQMPLTSAPTLPPEYTESLLVWFQKFFNRTIFPLFGVKS